MQCIGNGDPSFHRWSLHKAFMSAELLADITIIAALKNFVIQEAGRIKVRVLRGEDEIRLGSLVISLAPSEAAN
jgi:hypothetical protein